MNYRARKLYSKKLKNGSLKGILLFSTKHVLSFVKTGFQCGNFYTATQPWKVWWSEGLSKYDRVDFGRPATSLPAMFYVEDLSVNPEESGIRVTNLASNASRGAPPEAPWVIKVPLPGKTTWFVLLLFCFQ